MMAKDAVIKHKKQNKNVFIHKINDSTHSNANVFLKHIFALSYAYSNAAETEHLLNNFTKDVHLYCTLLITS